MASAWLRLAAERIVHGSYQKIHVVGVAEWDALKMHTRLRRQSPPVARGPRCIIITKPYYVTLRYGLIRETRPGRQRHMLSSVGAGALNFKPGPGPTTHDMPRHGPSARAPPPADAPRIPPAPAPRARRGISIRTRITA